MEWTRRELSCKVPLFFRPIRT